MLASLAAIAWTVCVSATALPAMAPTNPGAGVAADTVPVCCSIVRIDTARSRVTARELATGFTFAFEVRSRRQLRALKVGRPVWVDFGNRTVRLTADAPRPFCVILPLPTP